MGLLIKLKNGDTTFKSLKFGHDRPGGGDSGQPYIQTPIEGQNVNTDIDGDSIIRGGLTAPSKALEDSTRLTNYLFDFKNPNGLLFTVKQNLLSRIAAKTETSFGPAYGGFSQSRTVLGQGITSDGFNAGNGFFNEGIYTPLSTIMQSQVGYLGQHLNKQGLDPTGTFENATIKKYSDVVFENNKVENNGKGPIRSTIPLKLIRRQTRAGKKFFSATQQQIDAEGKATEELGRRESQTSFGTNTKVTSVLGALNPLNTFRGLREDGLTGAERGIKTGLKVNESINSFLLKWDRYRDSRALNKLGRKEGKELIAQENFAQAGQNVEDAYNENVEEVYYDNRLLNLWDSKGLNPEKPLGVPSGILYTYGGGPNSASGIGKTEIKFSTLNDNTTPLRTGYSGLDPYNGDYNYSINNPVIYSTFNIYGDAYNPTSVSIKYAQVTGIDLDEEIFGLTYGVNYLEAFDNKPDISIWGKDFVMGGGVYQDSNTGEIKGATWGTSDFTSIPKDLIKGNLKEDFRSRLVSSDTLSFIAKSPDYLTFNQENNVNLGRLNDPGKQGNVQVYKRGKGYVGTGLAKGPVDLINYSPIYKTTDSYDNSWYTKDFIKFNIGILSNSTNNKFYMHFRAFLDDFSDSYSSKWNSITYSNRGEEFYKYGSFSRGISLSFKVVALSRQELLPMYRKLNTLASSLAPQYSGKGYMGGTINVLTVGDYLDNQPGIIESLNFSIPKESPWNVIVDKQFNAGETDDIQNGELPFMMEVQMKFTPIHRFAPQLVNLSGIVDGQNEWSFGKGGTDTNTYKGKRRFINLPENGYSPDLTDGRDISSDAGAPPFDQTSILNTINAPISLDISTNNSPFVNNPLTQNNGLNNYSL